MPGMLHKAMAVSAVHTELIRVKIVIIMDRLGRLISHTLRLRRSIISNTRYHTGTDCSEANRNFQRH